LNNKAAEFTDFICDYKPDIAAITETWLHENESAARVSCTPIGYTLLDNPRSGRRGGGTGILFRKCLIANQHASGQFPSFEISEWKVTSGSLRIHLIVVYRPPYSEAHPITTSTFLAEFADYLESILLCTEKLIIMGDFYIHVDVTNDPDAVRFLELLNSMNLIQHVNIPTHISGHTLDLVITRNSDQLSISPPWTDHLFSDHLPVHCCVQVDTPTFDKKSQISYRKIKSINIETLQDEISKSELCNNTLLDLSDLVNCYNDTLSSVLDRHAPVIKKSVTKRPIAPWFNQEIKTAKKRKTTCREEVEKN